MAKQRDSKPDSIGIPDLVGYGSITDIVISNGIAISLKICDLLKEGKKTLTFDLDENHSLTETFVEMKAINMPLAIIRAPTGSETNYCFVGALPLLALNVKEFSDRLEGVFPIASGSEFVAYNTHPNYPQIKERLESSQPENRAYWILLAAGRRPTIQQLLIIDVLDQFEVPQCVAEKPYHDEYDEVGFYPVSPEKAIEIFESFESTSPTTGPLTGIPFQYVSNGCEERSHQMVKQILARKENIQPIKIWAFPHGTPYELLRFKTENSPLNCTARWSFHTAPAVMTTRGIRVIDPSTSACPDSVATWFGRFKTNQSKLYYTSHHIYSTRIGFCNRVFESDPEYLHSDLMIRVYRIHLRLQTCMFGAPPYPCS